MDEGQQPLSDQATILVVAEGETATAAELLIRDAAGLIPITIDWARAAGAATAPRLVAILADARGLPIDRLVAYLPGLVDAADVRMVVEIEPGQIDAAVAALATSDAILLCNPLPHERIGAIALASAATELAVRDTAGDAARFQQINAEVARFAETLARLAQRGDAAADGPQTVGEPMTGFAAQPVASDIDPATIRRAIRARRLRDDAFGQAGLFEDPAWDMLLDLFAAELERRQVSVSSLCIAAAVAPTTALRWIGRLGDAGLIERRPDAFDRRRAYVSLSARASTAMRNYLRTLRQAGLTIA